MVCYKFIDLILPLTYYSLKPGYFYELPHEILQYILHQKMRNIPRQTIKNILENGDF